MSEHQYEWMNGLHFSQTQWMNDIYFPPWCRAGPYFVGVLLGFLLFRINGKLKIHPVCWLFTCQRARLAFRIREQKVYCASYSYITFLLAVSFAFLSIIGCRCNCGMCKSKCRYSRGLFPYLMWKSSSSSLSFVIIWLDHKACSALKAAQQGAIKQRHKPLCTQKTQY